ncbi:MAG: dihydroneopterin aldolase [Gemmatimonadaceae bacterium]|nr:dihydroneopterin aldolase [Chitinophagaceae bacterium]
MEEKQRSLSSIADVVDYVVLNRIVTSAMAIPSPLLEESAERIIVNIASEYPFVKEVTVSIFKLNPPIDGFQGKVGVTLSKKFHAS